MEMGVFARFRQIIYERSGIVLTDQKKALLASRIQKRLRARGIQNESDYLQIIETDASGEELIHLINAISTNTTYFWREPQHFAIVSTEFARMRSEGKKRLRIWCAASSTGEEPYTLAMLMHQHFCSPSSEAHILATDVSTKALVTAIEGVYSSEDAQKLPENLRQKYLSPAQGSSSGGGMRVNDEVRHLLTFKKLNLVEFPYPLSGPVDIIFCRNVMIYFDTATRQKIVAQFERILAPAGLLFISLSESLLGISHSLARYQPSVYRRPGP